MIPMVFLGALVVVTTAGWQPQSISLTHPWGCSWGYKWIQMGITMVINPFNYDLWICIYILIYRVQFHTYNRNCTFKYAYVLFLARLTHQWQAKRGVSRLCFVWPSCAKWEIAGSATCSNPIPFIIEFRSSMLSKQMGIPPQNGKVTGSMMIHWHGAS